MRENSLALQLITLGVNHQTAPVSIREKMAFPIEKLSAALRELASRPEVTEAAILSTCNRTEIYCKAQHSEQVMDWLAHYHELNGQDIAQFLYTHHGQDAVRHAFRVASGLDSMVLGEPQILGQMKQAVKAAELAGTLGGLLNPLFQRTFSVAKEVRTHTEIGANSVSMSAAAVRLAGNIFGSLQEQQVLFIGAGEMIELAATHFAAQQPKHIMVANRTLERAQLLAAKFGGEAITLAELPERIAQFDIVVTSTASSLPILGKGLVERAIKLRKHRPMFMVDLAVPRDIEPEVGELDDVFLYTVDDLSEVVREGMDARQMAVAQAEAIIDTHVREFAHWLDSRTVVPTIRMLRDQMEGYRQAELARAHKMLARGDDPKTVLEAFSNGLINKFLHHPTRALHEATGEERNQLVRLLTRIHGVQDDH